MMRPIPTESLLSRRSIPPWGGFTTQWVSNLKLDAWRVFESCDTWTVAASIHRIFCIPGESSEIESSGNLRECGDWGVRSDDRTWGNSQRRRVIAGLVAGLHENPPTPGYEMISWLTGTFHQGTGCGRTRLCIGQQSLMLGA